MPALSETQRLVRNALVQSDFDAVRPVLVGGHDPAARLAIHRRHYHASLVGALRTRYPATAWLIGDVAVTTAATRYVVAHPPRVFCIAEFGADFPRFLGSELSLSAVPYIEAFAALEWQVGRVSVAVDSPAMTLADLATADSTSLMSSSLILQPGVVYMTMGWPVDALMRIYLSDQVPPQFEMTPAKTYVEVRGARGALHITSLSPATWTFRHLLQSGRAIGLAAETALDLDPQFDPGRALVELCDLSLLARLA